MSLKSKFSLVFGTLLMLVFFLVKSMVFLEMISSTPLTRLTEFLCFLFFIPFFITFVKEYLKKNKENVEQGKYIKRLNSILIDQSHNPLFYEGDITGSSKIITEKVVETIGNDRTSIWLYSDDKDALVCQQLHIKGDSKFYSGLELKREDYKSYFIHLAKEEVIAANNAEIHPATKCFKDSYLKPLGIKSMLDVPIKFGGLVIGVICIESYKLREWKEEEINFAEMLSSLYSFSYSVRETKLTEEKLVEFENFVNETALVSRADKNGKITYANKKFIEVCGYTPEEVMGNDHNIVNSKFHSKEFWSNMYKTTVVDKKVWHEIVTNKNKGGELYYVDTFIKAEFDEDGDLEGFISIRQDITELYESFNEINEKNTYLEHAAKILRHDMHSGINTYIPRGVSSLERRLDPEIIKKFKLESPMKMLKEGLAHAQRVYKGVYEFTNLVKKNSVLNRELCNLRDILLEHLGSTAYISQVAIDVLPTISVNQPLFCTAIDNLIRNGLKYNDSEFKMVAIFMEDEESLIIQDNGRGMTQEDFNILSKPYARREGQKETGTGLGLNICVAILKEHGFSISCEKNETGTKIKIKIK